MRKTSALVVLIAGLLTTMTAGLASAAAPIGRIIWLRASATGQFVSADLNRGSFAPLVADRATAGTWESFEVIDAGGGFIALRALGTGQFVAADAGRGAFAPLVADRPSAGTWENFRWTDLPGAAVTLTGRATGALVSADLNRGAFAPLVADRTTAGAWETFTWGLAGTAPPTPSPSPSPSGSPPGFPRLIWSDEFNGSSISGNWNFDTGNNGWGNNELQNYTNRSVNARVENGRLVIEARRESLGGSAYTSARINTGGHQAFGINTWVEARIQIPQGQGVWPAFWMLGTAIGSAGWPACGEIDIMEMRGQNPSQNLGTIHWAGPTNAHASFGGTLNTSSLAGGFHTFAVARTSTSIRWYVDGNQFHEANIAGGINSTQEFQGQFFIVLNVAIGGNFVGSPNAGTPLPQRMQVDYVRVWGR